jgi:hypothetical protein
MPSKRTYDYNGCEYKTGMAAARARQAFCDANMRLRAEARAQNPVPVEVRPEVTEAPQVEHPLWAWGPKERVLGGRSFSSIKGAALGFANTLADIFDGIDESISIEEIQALTGGSIGPRGRVYLYELDLAIQKTAPVGRANMTLTIMDAKGSRVLYVRSLDLSQR